MDVHVPEPRNHPLAAQVDAPRRGRNRDRAGGADRHDAIAARDHHLAGDRAPGFDVHDGGVQEGNRGGPLLGAECPAGREPDGDGTPREPARVAGSPAQRRRRAPHDQLKAFRPVIAWPSTSEWTSCVPSYV